jgi:Kef-type K+ transport system membrane component KefB
MTLVNAISSLTMPLLATATASDSASIMAAVLISLVVIYLASLIGSEICDRLNMPPVLGQLLGGLVVGISALHLLVFTDGGGDSGDSVLIKFLVATTGLSIDGAATIFQINSEVISVLAEIGVVILLFEIGLESDLKEFRLLRGIKIF